MQVSVCGTCPLGKDGFADKLRLALGAVAAEVVQVDCMSGCARESTVAFRSPGKVAYLFGDLTEADLPDLVAFAALYDSSTDGQFAYARVLGALRMKALARIPG
jgi:predicted metal-binding protein